jgi:hypothetical protein
MGQLRSIRYALILIALLVTTQAAWGASATDDFSGDLSNWTHFNGMDGGDLVIVSGQLVSAFGNSQVNYGMVYTPFTPANDQYAQAKVYLTGTGQIEAGVMVRADAAAGNAYYCMAQKNLGNGRTSTIRRWSGGSLQGSLIFESSTTWNAGDTLRCEVSGSPATIVLKRNSVTVLTSAPDANITSGKGGAVMYQDDATSAQTDLALDDFEVGDLGGAPAPSARAVVVTQ